MVPSVAHVELQVPVPSGDVRLADGDTVRGQKLTQIVPLVSETHLESAVAEED